MTVIQQDKERDWSQVLAILIVTLGSFTLGVFFTWPTQTIPILLQQGVTIEEASYLTVFPSLALMLSSPIFAVLLDKIGRKKTLVLVAVPQLIAWVLTASSDCIYVLYAARIFNGIGDACCFTVTPAYIAEIATPRVRGTWGNGLTFLAYVGNFMACFVGYYFSISTTACIFSVIPVVMLMGICFIPETPYYLIMKKEGEKAKESLRWLRRKHDVEAEYKQLTSDVERQLSERGRVRDLFIIASNRKALITAAFLRGAQQFSGVSSIAIYAHFIFAESGAQMSAHDSAMLFLGLLMFFNFFASIFLDRIGRRRCMIISCTGGTIILAIESVYFYLDQIMDTDGFKFVPMVGLSMFTLFFAMGVGIMPSLMLGELFSSSVKGKSLCVTNIFFGIFVATSTKLFQILYSNFGTHVGFAFFSACCFLSTIGSFYFVPETQGKTLEEIQQNMKKNKR